jgi:hypothetical protein
MGMLHPNCFRRAGIFPTGKLTLNRQLEYTTKRWLIDLVCAVTPLFRRGEWPYTKHGCLLKGPTMNPGFSRFAYMRKTGEGLHHEL